MNVNWSESVLSVSNSNETVNDHLLQMFVEDWSLEVNSDLYYVECGPMYCKSRRIVEVNLFYSLTLLISLYGGLVLIYRLLTPFLVNIIWKMKRHSTNIRFNLGKCSSQLIFHFRTFL